MVLFLEAVVAPLLTRLLGIGSATAVRSLGLHMLNGAVWRVCSAPLPAWPAAKLLLDILPVHFPCLSLSIQVDVVGLLV